MPGSDESRAQLKALHGDILSAVKTAYATLPYDDPAMTYVGTWSQLAATHLPDFIRAHDADSIDAEHARKVTSALSQGLEHFNEGVATKNLEKFKVSTYSIGALPGDHLIPPRRPTISDLPGDAIVLPGTPTVSPKPPRGASKEKSHDTEAG